MQHLCMSSTLTNQQTNAGQLASWPVPPPRGAHVRDGALYWIILTIVMNFQSATTYQALPQLSPQPSATYGNVERKRPCHALLHPHGAWGASRHQPRPSS